MTSLRGANLQKIRNGEKRYAVTPSLPAGFISPQQMKKYAEVAEKYKLNDFRHSCRSLGFVFLYHTVLFVSVHGMIMFSGR